MKVLGIKMTGHDTGAALIADDRVVAISEERLNRIKYSPHLFPKLSIDYCLKALNISPEELDLVVYDPAGTEDIDIPDYTVEDVHMKLGSRFAKVRLEYVNHHAAHAATAFFCSPFRESAVLVYDGSGEVFKTHFGVTAAETESFYHGLNAELTLINKTLHARSGPGRYPYTVGIGRLYALLSMGYLSFGRYNEGKMMGLAAYGDDSFLKQFPYERWVGGRAGQLVCNGSLVIPRSGLASRTSRADLIRLPRRIASALYVRAGRAIERFAMFLIRKNGRLFIAPNIFEPIVMPRPARDPKRDSLPDDYFSSVAFAGQKIFERFALDTAKRLRGATGSDNLCVAGGCGLNIDANLSFLKDAGFKNLFVQPASSDSGIPLGAALHGYHVILKRPREWEMKSASLGRAYSESEIKSAISEFESKIIARKSSRVCEEAAKFLADGKIIGWFHGGSEYGPRALGNRSILSDARSPEAKDILNERVKHRELWRPFAASVLEEKMGELFDPAIPSPFMLLTSRVREDKQAVIPSLVHKDGTCRTQSVTPQSNKKYYELIKAYDAITGVPAILNTSFNLGGEPIIESPHDALDTFTRTSMDYLILEDYIITKR
ncbi:MAG: carbamoyltransferase C-terminal domain-containing protein [bacterium]|nr:carbamoyltransferase C-terminal domain-containing protein [bacterium]